jgi:hypothetical protein
MYLKFQVLGALNLVVVHIESFYSSQEVSEVYSADGVVRATAPDQVAGMNSACLCLKAGYTEVL